MIILSLEKKNAINSYDIWALRFLGFRFFSLLDGVSLQNNLEYLFDSYHCREDTPVSFSALVPPDPDLVHQYFLVARMSPKFPLPLVPCRVFQPIVSFHQ